MESLIRSNNDIVSQWRGIRYLAYSTGKTGQLHEKNKSGFTHSILWLKDLNVKGKAEKLLEDNIRDFLWDLRRGKTSLRKSPSTTHKEEYYAIVIIKISY